MNNLSPTNLPIIKNKVQLGATVTGGLGAGAKPDIGRLSAEESIDEVLQYLEGSNMAFITAGMGGGTGTGAAPVIAKMARDNGILTVGVVTKPFHFEGTHRMKMAEEGIEEMQQYVDTLIVIPNQNLFRVANEKTTFAEAFKMADSVLQSGVSGVTDLIVRPGLINLDFADIRSAMLEMGKAMMGTGEAEGERRAIEAAEAAINNPLLDDVSMKGARGVIVNVTGGMDMTLFEVDEACNRIRDEVDPQANIIFGSTFDEKLEGLMRVSVVATGIDAVEAKGRVTVTGGGNLINSMTGSERKVERTQPNTGESQEKKSAEVAQVTSSVPATAPVTTPAYSAPVSPQTAAHMAAKKTDEPEADMFEQQEFVADSVAVPAERSSMRGSVHNNSFIPPAPVEVDRAQMDVFAETQHAEPQQEIVQEQIVEEQTQILAASKPVSQQETQTAQPTISAPTLNLKPPVPGAGAHQKQQTQKRTPSLFERFTNPIRQYAEDLGRQETSEDEGRNSGGGTSGGGMSPRTSAAPAQATLNIEKPKAADGAQADDELDIPAFLRRQAN